MTKRTSFKSITLSGAAAWAMILAAAAHAQEGEKRDFDIEAQPLAKALLEFNEQSGVLVMAPQALVEGKTAPAIEGEITADEALDRILSGSGLKSYASDSGAFTITLASAETTDPHPFQIARLQDTPTRQIESVDEDEGEGDALVIDVIVVTGTNIRGAVNPTAPLIGFDAEDIQLSGATTVQEFLRVVPQNFASTTPINANSSGNPFAPSGATNITNGTTVDLRGLGAGSTLVVFNGRRLAPSGNGNFFDVSSLPLSVIERVDVVADGASAIYGSDAVGGVVNFITRRDFEGFEVRGQYGGADGSFNQFTYGATAGARWDAGGIIGNIEFNDANALLGSDLDFANTDDVFGDGTVSPDQEALSGFVSIDQKITDRLGLTIDALYTDRSVNSVDLRASRNGASNDIDTETFFVNTRLDYEANEELTATLFVDYGEENTEFNQSVAASTGERENSLLVAEGQLTGETLQLPGGALSFAIGGQYRDEDFDAGSRELRGETGRDIWTAYGEILVPIIGPDQSIPLIESFTISAAGRYEDYSDFGDEFTPKVGAAWALNEGFLLRASYAESFRAPTLSQLREPQEWNFIDFGDPGLDPLDQDPRAPVGSSFLLFSSGGNPELVPETATSWSAGFDYTPSSVPGLTLNGSFFDIEYENRIEFVFFFDPLFIPEFSGLLERNPDQARLDEIFGRISSGQADLLNFASVDVPATPENVQVILNTGTQNVSAVEVQGLDFTAEYEWSVGDNEFSVGTNLSYLTQFDVFQTAESDSFDALNKIYRPTDLRLRSTFAWTRDGLTTFAALNHTNSYKNNLVGEENEDIDAWTTVDASVFYLFGDDSGVFGGTRIGLSVTNLFDEDPPFATTSDGLNYDPANANPLGRVLSISLSKSW